MPVLPRDTGEKGDVVRFELVRRQIVFECFFGLKAFFEVVAFRDQCISIFSTAHSVNDGGVALGLLCPRRQAREAKQRTQPINAEAIIQIHIYKYRGRPSDPLLASGESGAALATDLLVEYTVFWQAVKRFQMPCFTGPRRFRPS